MSRRLTHGLHRWVGIVSCLFMLLVSGTALALNHSDLWKPFFLKPVSTAQFGLGQARNLAADPHKSGHLWATDTKALYTSPDNGQHWQEIKLYVPVEKAVGLALGPEKGQIWVALREVGVFYSEDGGEIWEELTQLPFNPVSGEVIEKMWVGAGPQLHLQTEFAWYSVNFRGKSPTDPLQKFSWQRISLQEGQGQTRLEIQDLIWRLHTGRFAGPWGILLYDAVALSLIFLSLSGLWLSRRPKRKRLHHSADTGIPKSQAETCPTP